MFMETFAFDLIINQNEMPPLIPLISGNNNAIGFIFKSDTLRFNNHRNLL